jgi:hypothetical protein
MAWVIAAAWSVAAVPPAAADRVPRAHTIEVGGLTRTDLLRVLIGRVCRDIGASRVIREFFGKPWRGILA